MSLALQGSSPAAHRVLLDLAPATEGFAGIPHEARLLLQAFRQTDGFDPTGLLYDNQLAVFTHRFHDDASAARQLENHAVYLFKLSERIRRDTARAKEKAQRKELSFARSLLAACAQMRELLHCVFRLTARMQPIDRAVHAETVWRLVLSQSLGAAGLDVARQCPIMIANLSRAVLKFRALCHLPTLRLDTTGYDFLVLHEPMPLRVPAQTCKLIRHHDLIPALRPELVGSWQQIRTQLRGIRRCAADSVFVCNSEPTRTDLVRAFPVLEDRAVTIPDMLSEQNYADPQPCELPLICRHRAAPGCAAQAPDAEFPPFLLMVSTLEPRKNHIGLIRAYERLLARQDTDMILMFVGAAGWRNQEIRDAMQPLVRSGRLLHLTNVPPHELRTLYTHAEALVFPSFYEGFGYSPLEAMQCGVPAIVSDIPAHRWVYGDAAHYIDPFDAGDLCAALEKVVLTEDDSLRQRLVERGRERVKRYSLDVVARQWLALCDEIRRQGGAANVANLKLANFAPPSANPASSLDQTPAFAA